MPFDGVPVIRGKFMMEVLHIYEFDAITDTEMKDLRDNPRPESREL